MAKDLKTNAMRILEQNGINYFNCYNVKDLIFEIGKFIDENDCFCDMEDLEEVLDHLMEIHYYKEIKK